jgi:hypothetical protein
MAISLPPAEVSELKRQLNIYFSGADDTIIDEVFSKFDTRD